ncbi:MAG: RusA family crossover junction endodeoxyribonuclease, partial [Victivallaceae bacterium]
PFVFSEQTPLEMLLLFFHKKPKKPKTDGERWKITTPDLDNCAYLVSNALKSTIFPDDRQIVSLKCEKKVHPHFEGILIKINALQ